MSPIVEMRDVHVRFKGERTVHARPDLRGRDAVVLEAERDVVAGSRHDELRFRVLQHETGAAPHVKLALAVATGSVEETGERHKERALPRAGRSD